MEIIEPVVLIPAKVCFINVGFYQLPWVSTHGKKLIQESVNDLIILVAFIPIEGLLLGITNITIPYDTLAASIVVFVVMPLIAGYITHKMLLKRKERCRRLTGDVVFQTTLILNEYFKNIYLTNGHDNETVRKCMTCHSDKGKLSNVSNKMSCTPNHTESPGHIVFSDIHYKLMKAK